MRNKGKFAQHFHLTPEQGLLNDPNGLAYFDGYYHVFYQYNPYACDHTTKYWGHVRSKDLLNWEQLPIALKSDDWFDKNGVYSGGAIVYNQKLYLFYTGNTKDELGNRTSYQCMALSEDGIHFEKKGPILPQIPGYTGHVRDPKVWYDQEKAGWWMIIGAQKDDLTGDTLAYFSKDLEKWEDYGSILQFKNPLGYMWECPDLIFLNDEVTGQDKAVFIFSPQGLEAAGDKYQNIFNTTYLVGTWDNNKAKFIPDNDRLEEMMEVDCGFEFYAPQSFVDSQNRVIQYAWMGTMPEEIEKAVPSIKDDWIHQLSMPRTLHLVDGKLIQRPLKEYVQETKVEASSLEEGCLKLQGPSRIQIVLENLNDDAVRFVIDEATSIAITNQTIKVSRHNWLSHELEIRQASFKQVENLTLDLWIDTSSVELFVNGGSLTFSLRHFAEKPLSSFCVDYGIEKLSSIAVNKVRPYHFT